MLTPSDSRTDDFYLVAIIDEGETKVAQCMIDSHANTARPKGWKSLESSIPLFCVPDVESQVARKSYAASIHAPRTATELCPCSCRPQSTAVDTCLAPTPIGPNCCAYAYTERDLANRFEAESFEIIVTHEGGEKRPGYCRRWLPPGSENPVRAPNNLSLLEPTTHKLATAGAIGPPVSTCA